MILSRTAIFTRSQRDHGTSSLILYSVCEVLISNRFWVLRVKKNKKNLIIYRFFHRSLVFYHSFNNNYNNNNYYYYNNYYLLFMNLISAQYITKKTRWEWMDLEDCVSLNFQIVKVCLLWKLAYKILPFFFFFTWAWTPTIDTGGQYLKDS